MKIEKPYFDVGVYCITYNQSLYILDTLNGFCIQQTKTPFICAIFDDVSSDGEQEVIRKYLIDNFDECDHSLSIDKETNDYELLYVRHKKNQNCYFAVFFLKYNHFSIKKQRLPYLLDLVDVKYVAECEGDDYWIDPQKLQKQADILEKHPECTIAFCKVKDVSKNGCDLKSTKPNGNYVNPGIITIKDYLKYQYGQGKWVFQTSSFFYRSCNITELFNTDFYKAYPVGDTALVTELLLKGDGYYIDDVCSCYRVQSGGHTSHFKDNSELAIAYQEKLISSLSILDEITSYKFHKYLESRRLQSSFYIDFYKKNYVKMLAPKYWPLVFVISPRTQLIMALKIFCTPLYRFLRNRYLSK